MRQTGESSLQATVNVNTRTPSLLPFLPKTAVVRQSFLDQSSMSLRMFSTRTRVLSDLRMFVGYPDRWLSDHRGGHEDEG